MNMIDGQGGRDREPSALLGPEASDQRHPCGLLTPFTYLPSEVCRCGVVRHGKVCAGNERRQGPLFLGNENER